MTKSAVGFVALALVAAAIGFFGGSGPLVGLARVVFFLSALFGFIALLMGRDPGA